MSRLSLLLPVQPANAAGAGWPDGPPPIWDDTGSGFVEPDTGSRPELEPEVELAELELLWWGAQLLLLLVLLVPAACEAAGGACCTSGGGVVDDDNDAAAAAGVDDDDVDASLSAESSITTACST